MNKILHNGSGTNDVDAFKFDTCIIIRIIIIIINWAKVGPKLRILVQFIETWSFYF